MSDCTYAQTHQYSACESAGAVVGVCEGRHTPHSYRNTALKGQTIGREIKSGVINEKLDIYIKKLENK
jgi:hypothetical protein